MSETLVYNGKLDNGVEYEIHQTTSFSGRSEIAMMIKGEPVAVWSVDVKSTGTIECRPMMNAMKRIGVKKIEGVDPESENEGVVPEL